MFIFQWLLGYSLNHTDEITQGNQQCHSAMPFSDLWRRNFDANANDTESESERLSSSESGSESDDVPEADHVTELVRLRQRARTEKARAASLVAREKRKALVDHIPEHPAARFKPDLQPKPEINKHGNFTKPIHKRRLRVVFSWFVSWCLKFRQFLQKPDVVANHAFTVSIVDDTNMVLSENTEGAPHWRKSRVISVMNLVQSYVINYQDINQDAGCNECYHKTFLIHSPLVCLPKTNAETLASELSSWLLTFLGKVSERFQLFGIDASSTAAIPIQATLLCWDSLVTNMAILKKLRLSVYIKHQHDGIAALYPLLAVVCMLHQCALARKPIVYHYPGFWSSLVRLGHLFEVCSFRQQFKSALITLICNNFRVVTVSTLPACVKEWRQKRNSLCGLLGSDPSYSPKRTNIHWKLSQHDNGDPCGNDFAHWCIGSCCTGASHMEKANYALMQMCKGYVLLFCRGFPVPLLYRWVHAHKALGWCSDSWNEEWLMLLSAPPQKSPKTNSHSHTDTPVWGI